jgi:hypothetical protein
VSNGMAFGVVYEYVVTPVAQKALCREVVENLHLCPRGLAEVAEVFLSFVSRHGGTLHLLVDLVDAPFDRIDRVAEVDPVVCAVDRPRLAFFELGARLPFQSRRNKLLAKIMGTAKVLVHFLRHTPLEAGPP